MAVEYCEYCHLHIDTDSDAEHFDSDGDCVVKLEDEDREIQENK